MPQPQSHKTEYLHREHMNAAMSEEERAAQSAKEVARKTRYRQRKDATSAATTTASDYEIPVDIPEKFYQQYRCW